MRQPRPRGWAVLRHLAVPALALTVVATLSTPAPDRGAPDGLRAGAGPAAADAVGLNPAALTPVSVTSARNTGRRVDGNLLSYNDFHGAIDPPGGSGAAIAGVPAGGVEYLATWLNRLRAEARAEGRQSLTVGAGDLIGATPLVSAAFHDEPTIELMDLLGLQISSVGNHEFDEGVEELLRLDRGGCHPVDGCQDGDGFAGAKFTYLAANTISRRTGRPILPPVAIKRIGGVPVGFVGVTLEATPTIVNPAGIASVEFTDEVETANKWAGTLRRHGVTAMVLLVHEGGLQDPPPGTPAALSACAGFSGPIVDIVAGLRPEFGLVVSGHTHRAYTCQLPNSAGVPTAVTSAGSNGQLITDIDVSLDARNGRFTRVAARNVIVENGVRNADGSWQLNPSGGFARNPALVDPAAKRLADRYRAAVTPIANRVVGQITADIVRTARPNGESPLGDVIADAQLAYTRANGAQIALMNPGGIRADLSFASGGGEPGGAVTFGEVFTVQPFNNLVVTQTLTGAQLKEVLEQQFVGYAGQGTQRILQVSAGFTYTYDPALPAGSRVTALALNGAPIDPAVGYRVTTNDFLANGGDGFTRLSLGTDRVTAPGFDIDALTAYLSAGAAVAPGPADRITLATG